MSTAVAPACAELASVDRIWPMAGRDEELEYVHRALLIDGGVVLAGAAGVGKTRLARETVAAARRPARWVTATASARGVPLGAFIPVLGDVDIAAGAGAFHRAARALSSVSTTGSTGTPGDVLLVVDDAHLLDDVSAAMLHQLVLTRAATVVVTLRTGEPVPDAVRALWKDERLPRLEVQPLSEVETADLVETVLGGPVDGRCRRSLWSLTRGNALFLRQLVDGELGRGRLRPVDEVWQWEGTPAVGPGLTEIVEARLGRLSDDERRVCEVLALGEPLGVTLLMRLVDPAALDRIERRGLIAVETNGRRVEARLAHPLYGEVLRSRTTPLHARRLRGELARALAATGARRPGDTMRRAVLELDSHLPPDPELLATAARQAITLFDLPLAERLSRAAWLSGSEFRYGLMLAYVLSWQGRAAEAAPVLDAVAPHARDDGERAQLAVLRVANTFFTLRRPVEALRLLGEAQNAAEDTCRVELDGLWAALAAHLGRLPESIAAGSKALATSGATDVARSWAGFGLSQALGRTGRLTEARAAAATASDAVRTAGGGSVIGIQLAHATVTTLTLAGELSAAADAADRFRDLTRGTRSAGPMACLLAGQVATARGRLPAAVRALREARAGVAECDPGANTMYAGLLLPHALGMLGDAPGAREAQARAELDRHPGILLTGPDLVLGRAWVAAAEGVPSQAERFARQAATLAAADGQHAVEVVALHAAVCFGDTGAAARLTALAVTVQGPRARLAAAHATAFATGNAVGLDEVSRAAEAMDALLIAVDAAAQAAVVHERRGARVLAAAAATRARRLAQSCGGAVTPALRALPSMVPLTGREREVVALAAAALTNQEIAERLVVSVRTVEGHLYRAFAKLGVTERSALNRVT